ncbi:hypothetical protein GGR50DRAFT_225526 [Xylaria sp. CBS 124048]|nr:hypothetical protein GGR50DRAFT_225526 [Xylaria sp. CBS 124048]
MPRTLLLCFLHGFKGNDDTFRSFPADLEAQVAKQLPDDHVESVVYPKYETKGELGQCSVAFLAWLKERVMDVRKARCEVPWPPNDRDVGVILVAHSMGGFVASDTLFLILNERLIASSSESGNKETEKRAQIFPLIQGVLTFDTPFNGLARSMFVYGAFSNYQKVSSVFNVMTVLSAAPSALGTIAFRRTAGGLAAKSAARATGGTGRGWQILAARTGTIGAIAAGGVAAYVHRQKIMDGMRSMRNINKESVKEGYQQGVDTISQGLAYINRGNVGRSFEYLSDHFTFVGALLKQQQLAQRLERLAILKGVGIHDYYTSLGKNGMWSGGYFVPERTFCAIPSKDHEAHGLFSRRVIKNVDDEVQAHMSMFIRDKNDEYEQMTHEASELVIRWFADDSDIVDDPKLAEPPPPEPVEQPVTTAPDGREVPKIESIIENTDSATGELIPVEEDDIPVIPDESPLDITAAAAAVPLPDSDDDDAPSVANAKDAQRKTYMRYLMEVAQQAGTGVKSYVPTKMPEMPSGPNFKSFVPRSMPQIPQMPPMSSIYGPAVGMFGKKEQTDSTDSNTDSSKPAETSHEVSSEGMVVTGAIDRSDDIQHSIDPDRGLSHHEPEELNPPSLTAS